MKGMIIVHVDKCNACKSCEIACAVEHSVSKDLHQAIHEDPTPRARVSVQQGVSFSVPLQCRQCANAPCIALCPTDALYRTDADSPVLLDEEKCIGCNWCVLACPFGVISRDRDKHIAVKCDRCHKLDVPACVSACPTRALVLIDADGMSREKRRRLVLKEATGAD